MVDTLFLGSLLYSRTDTTLTGSLHLTWGKRITQKSPIFLEQQQREHEAARERAAKRRKLKESGQQVSKIDFAASSRKARV